MAFKNWWDSKSLGLRVVIAFFFLVLWPIGILALLIYFFDKDPQNKFLLAEENVERYKNLPGFDLVENYSNKYARSDSLDADSQKEQMLRQLLGKEGFAQAVVDSPTKLRQLAIDIYRVKTVNDTLNVLKQPGSTLKNNFTFEGICQKCANDWGENADNPLNIALVTHVLVKCNLGAYDDYFKVKSQIVKFKEEMALRDFKTRLNTQKRVSLADVDQMDGHAFEEFLANAVLPYMGYKVIEVKKSCDQGGDIIAERLGSRLVVQAKRYTGNVGNHAIGEVAGARDHYNCDDAWVITNAYFTKAAYALAKSTKVKLIDRDELKKLI